jgi:preprotein translocase subunit SecB
MTASPPDGPPEGQIHIMVNTQYIKDFSFESPNAPQIFTHLTAQPDLNVGVNVQTRPVGEGSYEVVLLLKLEAKAGDKTAFIAELAYGGVLTIPTVPGEQLKYLLLVEAPRLLFPFARSIIANVVSDGGFPPLLIHPIDFAAMYQAQTAQMDKPAEGSA